MTPPLKKPRLGILAPSGPPLDEARLVEGFRSLRALGLELVTPRDAYPTHGFLAGTDEARAWEFNTLADQDDLDLLLCVRGGYGTLRILDQIHYQAAAAKPRVLIGYSDITALQLALYRHAGWKGLSGAMLAVEWPEPDPRWQEPYWQLLSGAEAVSLTPLDGSQPIPMVPGEASGVLLGGNLAMIARLVGTPYLPDLAGCILFLEDVGETPYRLDALLAQLRLSGALANLSGVVLGQFTDSAPPPDRPSFSVEEVLEHYFGQASYPVVRNWNYGHFALKIPMPIGVQASLEVSGQGVTLTTREPLL
jgi:muramoyltetrapeptide carboxypeptidase